MTTPAESTDVLELSPCHIKTFRLYPNGSTSNESNTFNSVSAAFHRGIRPASTSSPVRSDGSRAPRAFFHWWGSGFVPVRKQRLSYPASGFRVVRELNGHVVQTNLNLIAQLAGCPWSSRTNTGSFPLTVDAMARTRFLNKLQDGKTDLGTTLGEAKSTISGISDVAEAMLGFVDTAAKRYRYEKREIIKLLLGIQTRPKKKRRSTNSEKRRIRNEKQILSWWLQVQFNLKPLFSDIQSSGEALSWLLFEENKPARLSVKAGATQEDTVIARLPTSYGGSLPTLDVPFKVSSSQHFSCVYEVDNRATRTISQLGLGNPAAIAWELTAFSWMVDYVLGVGDWLNSMFADTGLRFIEGSRSRIQRGVATGISSWSKPPSNYTLESGWTGVNMQVEFGRFERTVLSGPVYPALFPLVRSRLGLTQLANTLAVLAQLKR